jgi:hypothetical protein
MRSILPTQKGTSVLPKTQRNHAVLLRTHFKTLWRSEIHINLKFDTDAGVAFVSTVHVICIKDSEGSMLVSVHMYVYLCVCVCVVLYMRIRNEI